VPHDFSTDKAASAFHMTSAQIGHSLKATLDSTTSCDEKRYNNW
jgi:hypothetical protein